MTEQKSEGIYTYCIEYAKTTQSRCAACKKGISIKSLRAAEIFRKSPKEKKNLAKHTWYHFKCFKVPTLLTQIPIEQFRGYPSLKEKDKARVQKLIKHGKGATWTAIVEKEKAEEGEEEAVTKKKETIDENIDITEKLTGIQEKTEKNKTEKNKTEKNKTEKKKVEKKSDKKLKAKTEEKNKVNKKKKPATTEVVHKPKKVVLPTEDQIELESIAKEFQALRK
ncbi:hypothetical protein G6F68_006464 [Rhizopus microsporus]|nr:hypothetical protein G6F67_008907 [Rhizopus microsporus]KAG1261755.1 hypothetical protein G6F68_006464 [Rhizopus microsporus]